MTEERTPPALAALLKFDRRDAAGLCWIRERARFWLTALKRRRKCLPPGQPFSPEEAVTIRALVGLEEAAGQLLDFSPGPSGIEPERT